MTAADCFWCGAVATEVFGNNYLCDDCPPIDDEDGDEADESRTAAVYRAFTDAIEFYHRQLDREIVDHTAAGDHPDRPTTAREYFRARGWSDETIAAHRLGWVPPNAKDELIAWLFDRGHDRETILATGLVGEADDGRLYTTWSGRYVLPYFDTDGEPVYAIARCTGGKGGGGKGYDGHPADYQAGKYAKVRHTDERVPITEPIWGLETLADGEPVIIAEGIADAITATEAGYSVLSPVTKEFKRKHIRPLRDAIADHDVPAVYIIPDADPVAFTVPENAPDEPESIGDALEMPLAAAGLGGALRSAALLEDAFSETAGDDVPDVRVAALPHPARSADFAKVDLDDYLQEWSDSLAPVLASAKPARAFPAFDRATKHMVGYGSVDATKRETETETDVAGGGDGTVADDRTAAGSVSDDRDPDRNVDVDPADPHQSSLWALDIGDVTPAGYDAPGDRGRNPAAHTGESETYFVVREAEDSDDLLATDYKGAGGKAKYNALTYLLVEAGERPRDRPEGPLSDREVWLAWKHARDEGHLPLEDDDGGEYPDPIPLRALWHLAREHDVVDASEIPDDYDDRLPRAAYAATLELVRDEYGLDPERDADRSDTDDAEHVAVMPSDSTHPLVSAGAPSADVRHDRNHDITKQTVRDRTAETVTTLVERADSALVEVLPGGGKSYSAPLAAARTGKPAMIATGRGREEQYAQYKDWCHDHGLEAYVTPSFIEDCECADGKHGKKWEKTVKGWYDAGASPATIHKCAEAELGRPLPCQLDGRCPYTAKWDFDPENWDVLIGHYTHLHNEKVVKGRTVFIDEYPGGAYETTLTEPARVVSTYLESEPALPFDDWTDLLEGRHDDDRRAEGLTFFDKCGVERDEFQAFADGGHAIAPLVVYTLLASDDLGNGWERARLDDRSGVTGVYNREAGAVSILQPPALTYARNTIGLDGTPTRALWRTALGRTYFDHEQVLEGDERTAYIRDALNMKIVRTTDAVKGYAAGDDEITERVTAGEDAALLEAIADVHGEQPAGISTRRALKHVYDPEGVTELLDECKYHGNILGSNEFGDRQLGVVLGSRNFGPDYVAKWGAYMGEAIEPTFPGEDGNPLEAGARADYGPTGNKIRTHMTEHETLQAVLRFGRSEQVNGAVVYVHTNTLPDWVPIDSEARVVSTWSDGMRDVIEAARDLESDTWTTAELAAHPAVEVGERQVRNLLDELAERGVVTKETVGRGFQWGDDGVDDLNDYGEVDGELEAVLDALAPPVDATDVDEVAETSPITFYRWSFRNSPVDREPDRSIVAQPGRSVTDTADPPGPGG